jgi:mono/diheme cytochrome c family protein
VTPFFIAATLITAAPGTGDPLAGRGLAHQRCMECHDIGDPAAAGGPYAGPAFASVARRPGTTRRTIRAFLLGPHRRMPELSLSAQDADDLAAFIMRLRR